MTAIRVALIAAGVVMGCYGALLLVTDNPWPVLLNIGIWAAAGVFLHDFVFAPACVALGLTARRVLPHTVHTPVAIGALCSVVLVLLAIPVYSRPGARPDNPSVLDRDYPRGLWVALGLVWAAVALVLVAQRLAARRGNGGALTTPPSADATSQLEDTDAAKPDT